MYKYNKNLVSIIIPCYNGEKFLDDCLSAIMNQSYKKIQVVLIDDGSVDNSKFIVNKYKKSFEKNGMILDYIYQINSGQAAAVNNGLKLVLGEYLIWQDCDDWLEQDAVENLLKFLNENSSYNLVRGEVNFRKDTALDKVIKVGKSKKPHNFNIFDDYIFEKDSYCFTGIFMVRMKFFDSRVKNREIYTSRAGQNWQLILPVSYNSKCGYIQKVVHNYRIVSNSHSHSVKKFKDLVYRCKQHQDILLNVIKHIEEIDEKTLKKYEVKIKIKYIYRKARCFISSIKHLIWR